MFSIKTFVKIIQSPFSIVFPDGRVNDYDEWNQELITCILGKDYNEMKSPLFKNKTILYQRQTNKLIKENEIVKDFTLKRLFGVCIVMNC